MDRVLREIRNHRPTLSEREKLELWEGIERSLVAEMPWKDGTVAPRVMAAGDGRPGPAEGGRSKSGGRVRRWTGRRETVEAAAAGAVALMVVAVGAEVWLHHMASPSSLASLHHGPQTVNTAIGAHGLVQTLGTAEAPMYPAQPFPADAKLIAKDAQADGRVYVIV
ncbi:MAG: hypothetical protein IRZ10_07745, partial [Thermoflavifilum sp.]|nr:hypothetical protein [Thermoflavifilum sp.]MCL6514302.1 hypothetical protein [Alicyclobacillus sp.]